MMLWARVELKEMTEEGKFESYFKIDLVRHN